MYILLQHVSRLHLRCDVQILAVITVNGILQKSRFQTPVLEDTQKEREEEGM